MLKSKPISQQKQKQQQQQNKEKKQIRNHMLEKRECTSEDYLNIATRQISNAILASKEFTNAKSIGAYYSIGSEIPTQMLIVEMMKRGKNVYLPRVTNETKMEFALVLPTSKLRSSKFFTEIMEPEPKAHVTDHMDMILVPAIAASYNGYRLGYGHGYYDRYLTEYDKIKDTVIIALLLEKQLVKKLPVDKHDIKTDMIITEKRTISCN